MSKGPKKQGKTKTKKAKAQPKPAQPVTAEAEAKPRQTMAALRQEVRATWPEVKHLSDAKRKELVELVARGDKELFEQYQQEWRARAAARRKAWLEGASESAQAARSKEGR